MNGPAFGVFVDCRGVGGPVDNVSTFEAAVALARELVRSPVRRPARAYVVDLRTGLHAFEAVR